MKNYVVFKNKNYKFALRRLIFAKKYKLQILKKFFFQN